MTGIQADRFAPQNQMVGYFRNTLPSSCHDITCPPNMSSHALICVALVNPSIALRIGIPYPDYGYSNAEINMCVFSTARGNRRYTLSIMKRRCTPCPTVWYSNHKILAASQIRPTAVVFLEGLTSLWVLAKKRWNLKGFLTILCCRNSIF